MSAPQTGEALRNRARELLKRYAETLVAGQADATTLSPGSAAETIINLLDKCLALEADDTYVRLLDRFGVRLQREYHLQQVDALFAAVLEQESLNDAQRVAFADLRVRILIQLGEEELAQSVLDTVWPVANSPAIKARVCNRQGYLYAIYNHYVEAEQAYRAGIEAATAAGDMATLAILHSNYGDMFFQKNEYGNAINHYAKALEIAQPLGLSFACALAEGGLGMTLDQLGQYEEAVSHHEKARTFYKDIGDEFGIIRIDLNLSLNALKRGAYDQVIDLASRALGQAQELGDQHRMAFAHQRLGEAFLATRNYALACEHLTIALKQRLQLGKPVFIERTIESLQELLQAIAEDEKIPPDQRPSLLARCRDALETAPN